ncbi:MAG: hypothetical protein NZ480_01035 [Bdellovibrionaceae bacterium]|nr:hypothetical protein [Pseudobdellovibrionaceae bacterium]MDW8189935.1 hypothetical protein [Pseudobdellovibrionaceae bacterium]
MKNSELKVLLSFAHYGEAQFFFSDPYLSLQVDPQYPFFWRGKGFDLVLTGEGLWDAFYRLGLVLSCYRSSYSYILNLGICGSLIPEFKVGDVVAVDTSYLWYHGEWEGISFCRMREGDGVACGDRINGKWVDCVTHPQRVVEASYKRVLGGYAEIVDRELWAIGFLGNRYHLPWLSIKIVSDDVSNDTSCSLVFQARENFARALKSVFDTSFRNGSNSFDKKINQPLVTVQTNEEEVEAQVDSLLNDPDFYWTHSLKLQFVKLKDQLPHLEKKMIETLKQNKTLKPKVRAMKLLEYLRFCQDPLQRDLLKRQCDLQEGMAQQGIQLKFDERGERLFFQFAVDDAKSLEEKIFYLQNSLPLLFPLDKAPMVTQRASQDKST